MNPQLKEENIQWFLGFIMLHSSYKLDELLNLSEGEIKYIFDCLSIALKVEAGIPTEAQKELIEQRKKEEFDRLAQESIRRFQNVKKGPITLTDLLRI